MNFFEPNDQDPFNTSSLFMLQLACIINMVPVWKNLHLRVFQCENIQEDASLSIAEASGTANQFQKSTNTENEYKLRKLLNMLRISASINQVPEWSRLLEKLKNGSTTFSSSERDYSSTIDQVEHVANNLPESYLSRYARSYFLRKKFY